MKLTLRNASVVILSEGNNPKLLIHDFLARNSIVPEDWEIQDVVVTPPFSQLIYKNSVQFVVEINKLQFKVNQPDAINWKSVLPKMAIDYLHLLPHVSYNGVGINFLFQVVDLPGQYFERLLKEGPWFDRMGGMTGASIELRYHNQSPQLNMKLEDHSKQPGVKKDLGLALFVNYHQEFTPEQERERQEYIQQAPDLARRSLDFVQCLPLQ